MRAVESGPDGENLAAAWQGLEALPDPRSPQGGSTGGLPIAIAVCAFTAAGHDRFTAVGQWIRRASQADLARLDAPWDPIGGRYRAPDEKTIRVVLDRLDPGQPDPGPARTAPAPLRRACLGQRARLPGPGAPPSGRERWPGARLRAVAVDGKTSRGARRADGTRVHLLGVAEHGGHLLDHLEVDVKHNETSHFTGLLEPLDLAGAVVTLRCPAYGAGEPGDWAGTGEEGPLHRGDQAEPAAAVCPGQALPWAGSACGSVTRDTGHGRIETRTVKAAHVSRLDFPYACQAIKICRWRKDTATGKVSRETAYAVTGLTSADATAPDLARLVREHWSIEAHHHIRDTTFSEDTSTSRTGSGPANLATIRAAIIAAIKDAASPARPRRPTRPHHSCRNPPSPRPRLGRNGTFTEHAGALIVVNVAGVEERDQGRRIRDGHRQRLRHRRQIRPAGRLLACVNQQAR